ncbi:MAG TPA: malto-oligosyltrehalose synthase [Verrucomicrobiae bacterium]|nr:malto-oligosyltrehalose synthase [Verrucomicrobiae bacterium]
MTEQSGKGGESRVFPAAFRVPGSTYRLQLNAAFTFGDALEVGEYLHALGVTDCYASPILRARPGSSHGYDVCDWGELNPELGSQEEFERWSERLHQLGMGLLLDVVPNHMAADPRNPWWRDVLQYGQASPFSLWFDIDWHRADRGFRGKVLLPVLEDHYWKVLESGKVQVAIEPEGAVVTYHQAKLPLSPASVSLLEQDEPPGRERRPPGLLEETPNPSAGASPAAGSIELLHDLLQRQHYRLAYWRTAGEELNYRRFFDVAELVALRMELPDVFQATHELVLRLVREGKITGLRVDHPDGLWDPKQYFTRLQRALCSGPSDGSTTKERRAEAASEAPRTGAPPLYVVAEKILSGRETLPPDWPVAGTTGYDFLNLLNGLFINSANRGAMDEIYAEFAGRARDYSALVYESKLKILRGSLRSDLRRLGSLLRSIAARSRYSLDFTHNELQGALAAVIAAFPVYRTYITEGTEEPAPEEAAHIERAIETALAAQNGKDADPLGFIKALLLLRVPQDLDGAAQKECRRFVMKFQQLTGAVMAKGLEDTVFYNFNRFISLNEVGGAPDQFGTSLDVFHQQNQWRAEHWPHTLLASATHDTKRGEDLRARLNVLSEMPDEWRQAVLKWRELNAAKKTIVDGKEAPDANDEYFLYQTLIGSWEKETKDGPDSQQFGRRICEYMLKAIREAKVHTSWTEPNEAYENSMTSFIAQLLTDSPQNLFLDDFMLFQRKVAFFGLFNSLAQVVLKMTVPGVPDFYQGTELWDYSFVDPDNRRPVDYQKRKFLLAELQRSFNIPEADLPALLRGLLKNYQNGQIKLYLIWRVLHLRQRRRELFNRGAYVPILATGPKRDHVCAFARSNAEATTITLVPRFVPGLTKGAQRGALEADVWQDTSLLIPMANKTVRYRNVFTEQVITVEPGGRPLGIPDMLGLFPVAVLEQIE